MQARHHDIVDEQPIRLDVRAATFSDVTGALKDGVRDLKRRPGLGLFFVLVYALFGLTAFCWVRLI